MIRRRFRYLSAVAALAGGIACGSGKAGDRPMPGPAPEQPDAQGGGDADATCPPGGPDACVDQARIEADVSWIAAERVPGSEHWARVRDECSTRLEALGFQVEAHDYGTGTNIIGTLEGSDPSRRMILSAHYDHIDDCPGAADNAAGLAAVLEAARVLSTEELTHTLVVACWDEEESGLVGSEAYAARLASGDGGPPVELVVSFDSFGYSDSSPGSQMLPFGFDLLFPEEAAAIEARESRGDFIAAFGDEPTTDALAAIESYAEAAGVAVETLALSASEKESALTEDLRRSDHASFWAIDVPAIHLNDTANFRNPNYHCQGGTDSPATVDFNFVATGTRAVVDLAATRLR